MQSTILLLAILTPAMCPAQTKTAFSASQMKCDGATDDTAALQSAVKAAAQQGARLILPAGTCITTTPAVTLPDNLSIQGAGKLATTIRRKDGTNVASNMFTLNGKTGAVTISDLTIDYNKSAQTTGSDTIGTTAATIDGFTLQRTRIINSWSLAVAFRYRTGTFLKDIVIADNDFANNGRSLTDSVAESIANGDILIEPVIGLRIANNHADNTLGSFFLSGTGGNPSGMGNIVFTGNVLNAVHGFGIALGGGGPGAAGGSDVTIRDNTFNMSVTRQNVVDVAYWSHVIIDHNQIVPGTCRVSCGGVGDAPPASNISVTNNTIVGNPTAPTNNCIALGGNNEVITGNTCSGAGGAGIVLTGDPASGSHGSLVENNVVKNCSRSGQGTHAGIALYLPSGGRISDLTIKGNHVYDDQGSRATQTFGITLGSGGSNPSGFSNITVENNDVRKNKKAGILNNTQGSTGIVIRRNPGYDLR